MPGPHRRNSFSYKAINPIIKNILDERSTLDNTVQVGMPFIKVTSTVDLGKIAGYTDELGNYGFTLGIHAIQEDVKYEDIYANRSGDYLIGYTYTPTGETKRIYTPSPESINVGNIRILDKNVGLASNTDFSFIPPPGITSATVGRNRNGVISIAEIKISVPTLPQLEALHRTFLIPSVGMIVEWGQQFAPKRRNSFGENGLTDTTIERNMFPWYDRSALEAIMGRLARNQIGLEEILENYVYTTEGQYQWMYGKVATFSINSNGDGSFECSIRIVGPSEDSFAYSTRNTVVPPKLIRNNVPVVCGENSNSIESYFTNTVEGKNLKTLLEGMEGNNVLEGLEAWKGHVIKFDKSTGILGSAKRIVTGIGTGIANLFRSKSAQSSEENFGDSEDSYFMTWRFFVNVVLNNEDVGIKSIFKDALLTDEELGKISILRPYNNPGQDPLAAGDNGREGNNPLRDPYENFVGNSRFLRSTDPSTLIIVNETAAEEAKKELRRRGSEESILDPTDESKNMLKLGDFYESATGITDPSPTNGGENDRGFLSTGVWINHKAIVNSIAPSQTMMSGITNLLHRMNSATHNFWNLAIDPSEPEPNEDGVSFNYGIVDTNYRESSEYAVTEFFDKVHVFNKYIRNNDGTLVGSELIESSIDLNLPKLLFSQIATTGIHQESDMNMLSGDDTTDETHPRVPGAQEQLRKMFSITSLAPTGEFDRGPDLTQLSKAQRKELIEGAVCGESTTQLSANTAGRGAGSSAPDASTVQVRLRGNTPEKRIEYGRKQLEVLNKTLDFCNKSLPEGSGCISPPDETEEEPTADTPEAINIIANPCERLSNANEKRVCESARSEGITDNVELAQFLAQVGHESNFVAIAENLNYSASTLFNLFPRNYVDRNGVARVRSWGFVDLNDAQQVVNRGPEAIGNRIYGSRMDNNGEGFKYRGRGYIQLTGRDNYRSFSNFSGVDAVANPDYVLTEEGATKSAIWFWKTRVRRDSELAGNYANIERVTRLINGGQIGIEDRRNKFARITDAFGISTANLPQPTNQPQYSNRTIVRTPAMDWPRGRFPGPGRESSSSGRFAPPDTFNCNECNGIRDNIRRTQNAINLETQKAEAENAAEKAKSANPELEKAFRYIEILPDWMVTQITNSGNGIFSNAFGAAPGTLSMSGDLVLPGINGLRVGELFWIDRIPSFYRAFGAFQVISLEDVIGREGWTTKIHARFNYLGGAWTKATTTLLSEGSGITQADIERVGTI
jgi:putative chitinase